MFQQLTKITKVNCSNPNKHIFFRLYKPLNQTSFKKNDKSIKKMTNHTKKTSTILSEFLPSDFSLNINSTDFYINLMIEKCCF